MAVETPVSWDQFRGRVPRADEFRGRGPVTMGWAWHLLGTVPRAKEFRGQTSIEATPWPNQTLQKAVNGAYKGQRFATQSIQIPQNTAKTSETKNEGVWGGGNPTQKSHSICCKRTSSLAPPWPVS